MLFILAFSITMIMFGKCRATADTVMDHLQINLFMQGINGNENNVTRRVGIETVIPTIYRYNNQDTDLRVIIKDSSNNVLQVFDQTIESDVASETGKNDTPTPYYYNHIQAEYNTPSKSAYMFGAPWANNRAKTLERINCYINGTEANLLRNTGIYETSGDTQTIYKKKNNYLMRYKDKTFLETYTEYRTSGTILIDDYGEEIITKQPDGTKKIITYKINS